MTHAEARHRLGYPPLCSFIWHDDSDTIAPHELGFIGAHFPKAVFCDAPATGIVMHRSHLSGRVESHDYCATHGRLVADKVAAIEACVQPA